ncbi:Yeats family protein [Mycena indigotica]|uniref:Protein AF-9 homolog n=1 Tax=Mycena indigotica TaxID=2126181 RepID=A0A8H6T5Q9_9AGAR|nr:Yeats family protein [Mycena indigotica]KAF7309895.1 Yeats family protein [Mycena indigotica]
MSVQRERVKNLSIHRPIIYGNVASVLSPRQREQLAATAPDHTHTWTVAVRGAASPDKEAATSMVGGADDISYFVKRVSFKLHDTYPNPLRHVEKPPFEVTETGWGEFEIQIKITFVSDAGEKPVSFYHHLKLHPWAAAGDPEIPPLEVAVKLGSVHSWQYDEIVFTEPFNTFLDTLMKNPPTPLVKSRRKPIPFHLAHMEGLAASRGGTPEFTQQMEREETERLEDGRRTIMAEEDRWKLKLIEKERELEQLKKLVAERGK